MRIADSLTRTRVCAMHEGPRRKPNSIAQVMRLAR
jgi:hypothetical protein